MKKILFVLCLVFGIMFAVEAGADSSMVSVGMESGASYARFSGENGLDIYDAVYGNLLYHAAPGENVDIYSYDGGFTSEGKFDAPISMLSVISVELAPISWNSEPYRGYFRLDRDGGTFTVVNFIHMDNYLYSVLGEEMGDYFPLEALKAQAICAKNFALCAHGRHSGYDVCATTHCQVYGGVNSESPNIKAAVDAVSGQAAHYAGDLVQLYFFATSGGATEDVSNVWGSVSPYLVSVPDPYEPADRASRYTWSTVLTSWEIQSKLADKGIYIGEITNVTVDEVTPAGRALTLTITGTEGSHTVRRESCRTILGLSSQWFTVNPYYDEAGTLCFAIDGRGYGHGVGMSQWGAYGMAMQGFSYVDILVHYFPGISIY